MSIWATSTCSLNDTDLTPYDLGSWGSRATFMNGNAVLDAARDASKALVEAAAEMLEAEAEDIVVEERQGLGQGLRREARPRPRSSTTR